MDLEISLEMNLPCNSSTFFLQTGSCKESRSNLYSVSKQMALWLHIKFLLSKYLWLNVKK